MSFSLFALFKETVSLWLDHKAFQLSAALAYYALFSLGPLLVIFIGVSGLILGEQEVRHHLAQEMRSLVGESGADTVQSMVQSLNSERGNVLSTILGGFMLLFGAGGVFGQLKDALNTIWEVKPKPGLGITTFIRDRFLSFTMVLGTGFLLLISLAVTTLLAALNKRLEVLFMLPASTWLVIGFFISLTVISILFAMFFKYLPDARIAWRDVITGAVVTALLFNLGKFALGFYLGRASTVSYYGAAGAVVILLLWIYYGSLILLFGAEFTRAYARMRGRKIVPKAHSMRVKSKE